MNKTRIGVWGFGAMGRGIVEMIGQKPSLELVGVCDIHPDYQGKSTGEILEQGYVGENVPISKNIETVIGQKPEVMIIATDSHVHKSYSKIERVVMEGIHVISTAEEMAYPKANAPELSEKIDYLAKKHEVSVLGTGINPGFVMDLLAIILTAPMQSVTKIEITRVNSLSPYGKTVMDEQGVGLSLEEFNKMHSSGDLAGHVGFKESVYMISEALGVTVDTFDQKMEPIISGVDRKSLYGYCKKDHVAGINMTAEATVDGKPFIVMNHPQQIEPQAEGVYTGDYITIYGSPEIEMSVRPEIEGGIGTIAMCVNMIPRLLETTPGLKTMLDLKPPRAFFD